MYYIPGAGYDAPLNLAQGRVMHHGTIMFDSDLEALSQALRVSSDKIESNGLKSIRGRVTNVRPRLARDCGTEQFIAVLEAQLTEYFDAWTISPGTINMDDVRRIRLEKSYSRVCERRKRLAF